MTQSILFQHGTLAMLADGLFDGTITLKELLKKGDTGIGTAEGLDGELIILNGIAYQAKADGTVIQPDEDTLIPFANVHQWDPASEVDLNQCSTSDIMGVIEAEHLTNTMVGLTVAGEFDMVKTRAVKKQNKPYPTLAKTASEQAVFQKNSISGMLVGYYTPGLYEGMGVKGLHLHFISEDHQFGGHVLDFEVVSGELAYQAFSDFQLHLPVDNKDFMTYEPTALDDVKADIKKAE